MTGRIVLAAFTAIFCSCAAPQKEARPSEPLPAPPVVRQAPAPPVTPADAAKAVEVNMGLEIPEGWIGVKGKDADIPVFLVLRNEKTEAMIFIDFFPAPPLDVSAMASLSRGGLVKNGATCGEVSQDADGGVAGFTLTRPDGKAKGKQVFLRRSSRPDVVVTILGLWPPKHDKKMLPALDGVVTSITVK